MNGRMIIGVIVGLTPAVAIAAIILKNPELYFQIGHVLSFYCMLGLLTAVLTTLYLINRDFSTNVIFLINNSKRNRRAYVVANFIIACLIAIIYAVIGVVLCVICSRIGIPGELKVKFLVGFFVNLLLLIPTYYLLCYIMFLLGAKSGLIYTILTGALLFLPNIVASILLGVRNEVAREIIENFPLYFYPIYAGANPLSWKQYIIGLVLLVLAFVLVLKKSEKYE